MLSLPLPLVLSRVLSCARSCADHAMHYTPHALSRLVVRGSHCALQALQRCVRVIAKIAVNLQSCVRVIATHSIAWASGTVQRQSQLERTEPEQPCFLMHECRSNHRWNRTTTTSRCIGAVAADVASNSTCQTSVATLGRHGTLPANRSCSLLLLLRST